MLTTRAPAFPAARTEARASLLETLPTPFACRTFTRFAPHATPITPRPSSGAAITPAIRVPCPHASSELPSAVR